MAQHDAVLGSHFSNIEQQREANALGMWVFLVTEVMLFGTIFMVYAVYFYVYPEAFSESSRELNLLLSSINTAILLGSSLCMALAVHAAQLSNRKALVLFLVLTIILGLIFLGVKGFEYYEDYEKQLIPGIAYDFGEEYFYQAQLFFSLYFATTGLHAVHMIIGIVILAILAFFAWRGYYSSLNYDTIERAGLYWHFVDVAWVFIYPLYYLIGRGGS